LLGIGKRADMKTIPLVTTPDSRFVVFSDYTLTDPTRGIGKMGRRPYFLSGASLLMFDLKIMFLTLVKVLRREGVTH
jgi:hypothetical protein